MSRLLTAQLEAIGSHILIHILVAYGCLFIPDSHLVTGLIQPQVGHHRCHNGIIAQCSLFHHVFAADKHDTVSIYHISILIHRKTAIRVSVIGKAYIQMLLLHKLLQGLNMGRSAVSIDVCAVRVIVDHVGLCSQSVKYTLGNSGSTAVGAVQTYPHIFKGAGGQGNQVSQITVPSG